MKNINDPQVLQEVFQRLDALDPDTPHLWGTMTVAQMLLHCRKQVGLGTGDVKSKKLYPAPLQWLIKHTVGFLIPWSRNLPTAPAMVSTKEDGLDFQTELSALKNIVNQFIALPENAALSGHPIFGSMTKDEWGRIIYKHLDHHLHQFGEQH
ncbi:MAG: DUF1569 domain-containing protein [Flavobacteriales bacterium]|nr:DUF1569 domain-containing protein [Flavobacteriales bacterium]